MLNRLLFAGLTCPLHSALLVFAAVLAVVAPTPAAAAEDATRMRLLVSDLTVNGVEPRVAKAITTLVTAELNRRNVFDIITGDDLRKVAELEAERQAAGCDNQEGCLSEIASALGAQRVVYGDITRLGGELIVSMTLLDAESSRALARASRRIESESGLANAVPILVDELLPQTKTVKTQPDAPAPANPEPTDDVGGSLFPTVLLGGGGVAVAVGAVAMVVGVVPLLLHFRTKGELESLAQSGTLADLDDAKALQADQATYAALWSPWGGIGVAAGAAAVLAGAMTVGAGGALFALSGESE